MSDGSPDGMAKAARLLTAAGVWLVLAAAAAGVWRWGVSPILNRRANAEAAQVERESARSEYDAAVNAATSAGYDPPAGASDASPDDLRAAAARLREAINGGRELTEAQWAALKPAGEPTIQPVTFARSSAAIRVPFDKWLEKAAAELKPMPFRFVRVIATVDANAGEIDRALARDRADAAAAVLVKAGMPANRVRADVLEGEGSAQVRFIVGSPGG